MDRQSLNRSTQTIDLPEELIFVKYKYRRGPYLVSYRGYEYSLLRKELNVREKRLLLCYICKGVMFEASMNKESRFVCSSCATDGGSASPVEPIREAISELSARCPLNIRGCEWVGTIAILKTHIEKCDYLFTECPLECGNSMLLKFMSEHTESSCEERIISCDLCPISIKAKWLSQHLGECPNYLINCNKCQEILHRHYLHHHKSASCQFRFVECPYAKYGCADKLLFCELDKHVQDNKDQHLRILESSHKQLEQNYSKEITQLNLKCQKMISFMYSEQVQISFPCNLTDINHLRVRHSNISAQNVKFEYNNEILHLHIIRKQNRLYFAILFPSIREGSVTTLLINQDNINKSVLFQNVKLGYCWLFNVLTKDYSNVVPKEEQKVIPFCSVITTGLETSLLQPPYLKGDNFKLRIVFFDVIDFRNL
ncbi:TNF receptor-associated factor 6-like isoform X5 [Oopsacas minuta]|uniref:TNF receptor-associated factor 6-like isoform X5 n=1 Tax=Oopsacas minuta TaxID=111878 RepID=A0AAV7JBP2_9METZ|nr:TNF receptor-associated factor 6-like isoform X5 [Oopsacas minuta]